jgi:hypothetical protein
MKRFIQAALVACCAAAALTAQADAPNFKGKMKAGEYEYTMTMEMGAMPGMPANMQGMKMPGTTFKQCVTQKQIDDGNQAAMGQRSPGGKDMPKDCEMKDMKMVGDTVSYKMVCTGEMKMDADVTMTFTANGFKSQTKMKGERAGQPMNMNSNMEAKYLGACKS